MESTFASSETRDNSKLSVPSVFEYRHYRRFIQDVFSSMRTEDPNFSIRRFCKKAGFASTGTFRFIVLGKRNLSPKSISKLTKAFEMTRQEEAYFRLLVEFDQAKDPKMKTEFYEKINSFRPHYGAKLLETEQFFYYSSWVNPTLRELVGLANFSEDLDWIAKQFTVPLKTQEIKEGLQLLLHLGLIHRDPVTQRLVQSHSQVTSPEVARGRCYSTYYQQLSELAILSIQRVNLEERELAGLTLTLDKERFESFRRDLIRFKKDMFEKYGESAASDDRVFHLNLQLFPLTQVVKKP